MLRLISKITIEQTPNDYFPNRISTYLLYHLTDFKCDSSWQNMADTATLIIPKKVPVIDSYNLNKVYLDSKNISENNNTNPILLRGDKVKVELGYIYKTDLGEQKELNTVFIGYITDIQVKQEIRLELMDEMYILQQKSCKAKSYTKAKLIDLLIDQLGGDKYQMALNSVNVDIGDYTVDFTNGRITIAELLQHIKDVYRIDFFFTFQPDDSFILWCNNLVYLPQRRKLVSFAFQENIINDNLEWQTTKDIKIKIKVSSKNKIFDGYTKKGKAKTKTVVYSYETGVDGGEVRSFQSPNMSQLQCQNMAEAEKNKLFYEGFKGSFLTFGQPLVKHGYAISLTDKINPERNGTYLVKEVSTSFGMDGYRQDISLAIKISNINGKY